jgi:signal transduction histidine kinase
MPQTDAPVTYYLPAERNSPQSVAAASSLVASSQARLFFDDYPLGTVLLDETRLIVYANKAFLKLAATPEGEMLGKRPGEALGCVRCGLNAAGCGTSLFCRYCGAARSLEASLGGGVATEECLISRRKAGRAEEPLELMVWTSPLRIEGADLIILAARDISAQKRREALERVFYHDIANTATGIEGLLELVEAEEGAEAARYRDLLRAASAQLAEEIAAQRALKSAEDGTLTAEPRVVDGRRVLEEALGLFAYYLYNRDVGARIDPDCERFELETDPVLLKRVLVNMIKNALEAAGRGETVRLSVARSGDRAVFSVGNAAVMSDEARARVFQRSFSTKGRGRGLGSYAMKLLGETHLGGQVSFTSSEGEGTTFRLSLPLVSAPADPR